MTEIKLRPYQQDFIDAVRLQFKSNRHVCGVAPCGAGKTIMTGWMIRESLRRNKRSLFFVHRQELIAQTAATFNQLGIPHGIINSHAPFQPNLPVQIASVQSLASKLDLLPEPDFLICDECHHILANSYLKILKKFPKAYLLGVTATPQRYGGITLGDVFESLVEGLTVNQLIEIGSLTQFQYFAPKTNIDLSTVHSSFGEFNQDELADLMSDADIIGDIVDNYLRLANGKSAICYCVNVEHSKIVAQAFNERGIIAAQCDGNTPTRERNQIVDGFRRGNIKILCNAELFGEGFDVPNMQAVILARPTQSLTLFIQQALRPLRPDPNDPNKVAVIIDHVQNYLRHGLPNKNHRWSLEPNIEHKVKCPNCHKMVKPLREAGKRTCPLCGYEFAKGDGVAIERKEKSSTDADLIELDVDFSTDSNIVEPTIIKRPTTIEEFIAIAKQRKYKLAWAVFRAKEFARTYDDFLHIATVCGYKKGWAWHKWQESLELKN